VRARRRANLMQSRRSPANLSFSTPARRLIDVQPSK